MSASARALHLGRTLAVVAAVVLLAGAARAAEPEFPALSGRVVDAAGILSGSVREELTQMLARQQASTGQQLVVVTLKSLQGFTIEEFGYQLGRHWGIGQKGQNNGVLLIVAPNERKVRIEVGYGLEDRLTDAASRTIIDQQILPRFRQGDFSAGTLEGAAAILQVLGSDQSIAGLPKRTIGITIGNTIFLGVFFGLFVVLPICGGVVQRRRRRRSSHDSWTGSDPVGERLGLVAVPRPSSHDSSGWKRRSSHDSRDESDGSSSSSGSSGSDSSSGGGGDFGGGGASGSW
jgi:uncharacterized protein